MNKLFLALGCALFFSLSASGDIVPTYYNSGSDFTWSETSANSGVWVGSSTAEDYRNEVWERPVKDSTLNISGTTWTTTDLYFGYGDLKSAKWGFGSSMGDDYLFVQWEVVGGFSSKSGDARINDGLKGHYYFYFKTDGGVAAAVEINDATGLTGTYASGEVKRLLDTNNDVTGSGLNITFDDDPNEKNGDSHDDSQTAGLARSSGNIVEAAVKLSDFGLSLSDFTSSTQYAYAGVAVSNPSSPGSDLFANDEYSEAFGSGVEYDTLRLGNAIPEPSGMLVIGLCIAIVGLRKKRSV